MQNIYFCICKTICFAQVYVFASAKVYTLYKTYSFAYAKYIVLRICLKDGVLKMKNKIIFLITYTNHNKIICLFWILHQKKLVLELQRLLTPCTFWNTPNNWKLLLDLDIIWDITASWETGKLHLHIQIITNKSSFSFYITDKLVLVAKGSWPALWYLLDQANQLKVIVGSGPPGNHPKRSPSHEKIDKLYLHRQIITNFLSLFLFLFSLLQTNLFW